MDRPRNPDGLLLCVAAAAILAAPGAGAQTQSTAARHREAAIELLRNGDAQASLTEIHKALALDPNDAASHDALGEARLNLGLNLWNRYKRSTGSRPKKDLDQAREELRRAVDLAPRDAAFHAALGQFLSETQDLDAAVAQLREAAALAPDRAEHAYNLGLALRLAGKLREAEAQFQRALGLDSHHALAWRALGLVRRQNGEYRAAADALQHSVDGNPGDAQARPLLATVLLKLDRADEATRELREAIRLDPAMTEARVTLAQTLARAGRMAEAREQQAEVRRINAEDADHGRALVLLQTAADRIQRGEVTPAIDDLREAAALNPRFAETHYQLGLALARSGAHAEDAEASFRRAIELDPGRAAAHYQLGLLLARRDRAGAAGELQAALAAEPGLAEAHRALARMASDEGNLSTAVSELQKVVIWSPRNADAHLQLAAALKASGDAAGAARETTIAWRLQHAPRPPR